MSGKTVLRVIFSCIFLALFTVSVWASLHQSVLQWGGLRHGPDRYWTLATLMDAYGGFLTFYAWVFYKERNTLPKMLWFLAIMLLGNMAMSAYMLLQLRRLRPDQDAAGLLLRSA